MKKIILLLGFVYVVAYPVFGKGKYIAGTQNYVHALKKVTDIMVNDVTSPVAASRYYAYVTLAAYETVSLYDKTGSPSLAGQLNQLENINVDAQLLTSTSPELAVMLSIFKAGEQLMPSGYLLKNDIDSIAGLYSANRKQQLLYKNTALLADEVLKQIVAYAKADGFVRLNNLQRYTPIQGDAFWKPTPPSYMAPVEPHWNRLRTFMLDSAQQFKTKWPANYDTAINASFFIQLREVYDIVKKADKDQQDIAMFWDCNPFAVQQIGHVEFGLKKISPGGHWIGITGIACIKEKLSLSKTAYAHVLVSLALADAFIACWDEKYRSNRVRPETAIQKLIDQRWQPLLQTPPFPEYVSGHSVASTAAAVTLTHLFGDQFSFTDDTEVEFGLPVRTFNSFLQAASEAAISRLYGGIHFRDAIEEGVWQGKMVGEFIRNKLNHHFHLK